ncbi:hypothetical protein KXD96_28195 (plasmid) [Mycobacterium sp. SMC-2]|nr:hypothetical protein KXD96_28195 [Mycobacterium sp. SMC-2]
MAGPDFPSRARPFSYALVVQTERRRSILTVPTPDEARQGMRALLNHVPETMPATHSVLYLLESLRSVRGDEGDISIEKLHQVVSKFAATFSICVQTLENRIERLEGRPGINDSTWEAIMVEFGLLSG